jgi:hypothetical protein
MHREIGELKVELDRRAEVRDQTADATGWIEPCEVLAVAQQCLLGEHAVPPSMLTLNKRHQQPNKASRCNRLVDDDDARHRSCDSSRMFPAAKPPAVRLPARDGTIARDRLVAAWPAEYSVPDGRDSSPPAENGATRHARHLN